MFKNLKIAPKLIASFIIVVLIASISGVAGTFFLLQSDKDYSNALVENGFSQGEIGTFNTYLNKGAAVVRDIVMLTNEADIKASQDELSQIQEKTSQALEALKLNCTTEEELKYIAIIDQKLPEYRKLRDQVTELGLVNRNEEALALFRTQAQPVLNEVMTAAEELSSFNVDMGYEVSEDLSKQSTTIVLVMVAIIIAAAVISIGFAIVIARTIAQPVIKVRDAAAQLARGDLNIIIEASSQDEVGEMTHSFRDAAQMMRRYIEEISRGLTEIAAGNFAIDSKEEFLGDFKGIENAIRTIIQSLSMTMGEINQAAEQVSAGSDQVSSGAQALSQGATEQASSVEELAASINEISNQVKENAQNAADANLKAAETGKQTMQSNQQMQELTDAMAKISQSSNEIEKIIKTIEDIAFQTNILALNAAVEAARAGEAGKGFAVVADEVRNLAGKSSEASKSTAALIEDSMRAVGNGTRIAAETAEALLGVVEGSKVVADTIEKISESSKEQAESIEQITQGIDQISSVVQTNSATAEESAAASEELSGQAQLLKELVGRFRLKDGE